VSARPKLFDLGRMERPGGPQYFAVACGAGYDARVMAGTLTRHKRRWGMAAYVATTLRLIPDLRSTVHAIVIDGVEYEADASMVLVANCGEVIPPFVKLGPGIVPDDVWLTSMAVAFSAQITQSIGPALRPRSSALRWTWGRSRWMSPRGLVMCRPPLVSTLPGHHDTWALIMWVLVRMKANVLTNAIKIRKWVSLPGTWMCWS
jgi:hypothetical protein